MEAPPVSSSILLNSTSRPNGQKSPSQSRSSSKRWPKEQIRALQLPRNTLDPNKLQRKGGLQESTTIIIRKQITLHLKRYQKPEDIRGQ
jgi:hypothetical protein